MVSLAGSAAPWWLYFDEVAVHARRRLHGGGSWSDRPRRLHLPPHPIVAGVILTAVGGLVIAHPLRSLSTAGLLAVVGGPAFYLLGHLLFRLRMTGTASHKRLGALAALAVGALGFSGAGALVVAVVTVVVLAALAASELRNRLSVTRPAV